jgi:spore coat polysaccharide biosynthesis predicted glycosyltransferase SpsG
VLTGAAYPHLLALNTFIKNSNLAIDHQHDCQDVAQLMGTARLAVSAAGASQFELLCCATPAVLVVLAENQQFASQQAKQQGWCKVIDYQQDDSDLGLNHILQSAHSLWGQPQVLNDMHDQARLLATQSGIEHIIGQLY